MSRATACARSCRGRPSRFASSPRARQQAARSSPARRPSSPPAMRSSWASTSATILPTHARRPTPSPARPRRKAHTTMARSGIARRQGPRASVAGGDGASSPVKLGKKEEGVVAKLITPHERRLSPRRCAAATPSARLASATSCKWRSVRGAFHAQRHAPQGLSGLV